MRWSHPLGISRSARGRELCRSIDFPEWRGCQILFLCQPPTAFPHALTSIKQLLDSAVVISKDSVVQGCAALEAGTVVQSVVEVILSGYQDWGDSNANPPISNKCQESPISPWCFLSLPQSSTRLTKHIMHLQCAGPSVRGERRYNKAS